MLIPLNWLKDHLETTASVEDLCDALVQLGHEVEEVKDQSAQYAGVVVGHVLEREQHPDADKLGVCKVDIGAGEPKQIVCGAPNARAGITVAVATEGTVLPGDFKIKKSKIRGVDSCGMICSVRELGLGDEHEGIWELPQDMVQDKPLGTPLADVLGSEIIIEVAITPNRGDVLSIHGVARDLAALGLGQLKALPSCEAGEGAPKIGCETNSENCSFFSGMEIRGLKNTESPSWLKQRLEAMGLQPRSALVDITNYVMFDLGQPLHAYDADKIQGDKIYAADAKGGEPFKGLMEVDTKLAEGDVAICDGSGVVGLGGILGGEGSSVSDDTTNVYLEAAHFTRARIAQTGQRLDLQTDARYRFERGVDVTNTAYAARRAAQLIQEICGGTLSAQTTAGSDEKDLEAILFPIDFVKTFGGLEMDKAAITEHLTALHFQVEEKGDVLHVTPPAFRTTMDTPEDIVEELLRMAGYDAVPVVLPPLPTERQNLPAPGLNADRLARRQLASMGFGEIISYSFISEKNANAFANGQPLRHLANPIDTETMKTLRPSLLPGLLEAAQKNQARSEEFFCLAEVGKVFTTQTETLSAAALCLTDTRRHWQGQPAPVDAFTAKGQALAMLTQLGLRADKMQIRTENLPAHFHPGRSGMLALGKNVFGTFGEIHPGLLKQFDLAAPVAAFELNLTATESIKAKTGQFTFAQYQPVRRDLAFVVDAAVAGGDVLNTARNQLKDLARDVSLFDVYEGENVPEGKKSLALSLTLQSAKKTLEEGDITTAINNVIQAVQKHYSAELRS